MSVLNVGLRITDDMLRGASGPPPETVVRTARGTSHEWGQGDIFTHTMNPVSVDAGCWLLVGIAYDEALAASCSQIIINGLELTTLESRGFDAGAIAMQLWGRYFASAVAAQDLVAWFDSEMGMPSAVAMLAVQVAGLATSSALDVTAEATGTGTSPSSGATGTPAQAHEYVFGLVGTNGPESDAAGTWGASLSAGQRVGEAGGAEAITISEGYRVATVQAAQTANKTGITSRPWGAICATFKAAA